MSLCSLVESWCGEIAVSVVVIMCYLMYWKIQKRGKNKLPPGPIPWPVVGNLLQVGDNLHLTVNSWRKQYGDVISVKFGSKTVVVVSGQAAVGECLNTQSVLFSARPKFLTSKYVLRGKSLTFSNLDVSTHKQYRHLAMCALREITKPQQSFDNSITGGDGGLRLERPYVEQLLLDEGKSLGERLVEISELSQHSTSELTSAVQNEILSTVCVINASVLFGKRYNCNDEQVKEMVSVFRSLRTNDPMLVNVMPWLQTILKSRLRRFMNLNQRIEKIVTTHEAVVRLQRETCNGNSDHKSAQNNDSVLDYLLKTLEENKHEKKYDRERSILLLGDLLGAGNDTICGAITWIIVYAATFQDVQEKMRQEILDFQQKSHRLITYADRDQLPYIMSYIAEVLRHSSFVPFTIPHAPHRDANLLGFHIPQGTVLMANLWSINRDPDLWEDCHVFRPERFIKTDGTFDRVKADRVNIFGGGRRRCAGEHLARIELFLIVIALFKQFRFERLHGHTELPETMVTLIIHPKTIDVKTSALG